MQRLQDEGLTPAEVLAFRRKLMAWYLEFARELPWRGIADPYRTWVSEIMLQQTRVAAVIDHYARFLESFPTLLSLALAPEADVLALWSGLGYYRRARMLHKAAQFVVGQLGGQLPRTADELRSLPGIGEYTSAAIASISFGESVAVVDGNVERVLLRLTGRAQQKTAAARAFIRQEAGKLVPQRRMSPGRNAAGDHNQAMMELGATICLPKGPLCLHCPVFEMCATRGEHVTTPRDRQTSRPVAALLATRKRGGATEVLLERRSAEASLMAGMLELPPLPLDAVAGREALLNVRHSITTTNYYVSVYGEAQGPLRNEVPAARAVLEWHAVHRVGALPLTGLARKVLKRMDLFSVAGPETPEAKIARRS